MRKKIDNDESPNIEPSGVYDTVASDQLSYKSVFKYNSNIIGMYNRFCIHEWWKHPRYQVHNSLSLSKGIIIK